MSQCSFELKVSGLIIFCVDIVSMEFEFAFHVYGLDMTPLGC